MWACCLTGGAALGMSWVEVVCRAGSELVAGWTEDQLVGTVDLVVVFVCVGMVLEDYLGAGWGGAGDGDVCAAVG